MNMKSNWADAYENIFPLDKKDKKDYTKSTIMRIKLNAFNNDATADSALDYLYNKGNQSKTQSFLQNNGFPSAGERQFYKELYGVQAEQKQMRDLLRNKTDSILNTKLPNETDRAFLTGLMGEKAGEQDYQKQLSNAKSARSDLQTAFRGSQFESGLKLSAPANSASDEKKYVSSGISNAGDEIKHMAVLEPNSAYDIAHRLPSNTLNDTYRDGVTLAANTAAKKPKTSSSDYVQARYAAMAHGGSVKWNDSTKTATVTINGITKDYYAGDGRGTFIDSTNNRMWIADSVLYREHNINLGIYGPPRYQNLSREAKVLIATVASEAIGENVDSRKAVANAIINRVFSNRFRGNSIEEIVSEPYQFSGFKGNEYIKAMDYMNNRDYTNSTYEKLIDQVMDVYCGYEYDTTHGSTLFYSPKSMVPMGSEPQWNFSELQEMYVSPNIDKNAFRFYKYK